MTRGAPSELRRFAALHQDVEAVLERCGRETFDVVLIDSSGACTRWVLASAGSALVEGGRGREHGRRVLRVTVDGEGGVDLDAIALASERVSRRLDLAGFNPGPYSLEVSSPGLERPLRELRDFAKNVGERATVKTAAPIDGAMTLSGTIL